MAPVESTGQLKRVTRRKTASTTTRPPGSKDVFDVPEDQIDQDPPRTAPNTAPQTAPPNKAVKRGGPRKKNGAQGKAKEANSKPNVAKRQGNGIKSHEKASVELPVDQPATGGEDGDEPSDSDAVARSQREGETNGNRGSNGVEDDVEENKEVEDENEEEEDDQEEDIWGDDDLNGQSKLWKKILKERRMLEKRLEKQSNLNVRTSEFKRIKKIIRKAQNCYEIIIEKGTTDIVTEDLRIRCRELQTKLYSISEKTMPVRRGIIAFDMYAFAIPEMIELISLAFEARLDPFPGRERLADLLEVIVILKIAVALCNKARNLGTAPSPKIYVVRHTQQVFLPNLKAILKDFQYEHQLMTLETERDQDEADRMKYFEDQALRREEVTNEIRALIRENRAGIRSDIERIPDPFQPQRTRLRTPQSSQETGKDEWTVEQDGELIRELARLGDVDCTWLPPCCLITTNTKTEQ